MSMNKLATMLGAYGMFAAMTAMSGDYGTRKKEYEELNEKEREELRTKIEKKRIETIKKDGVMEFHYGDNVVYARNKQNADKKAKNKGYI